MYYSLLFSMPNTTKVITNLYQRFQSNQQTITKIYNSYSVNKDQTIWVITDFTTWSLIFLYPYLEKKHLSLVGQITEFREGDQERPQTRKCRNYYNFEQATGNPRTFVYAPGHLWKREEKKRCICCDSNTPLCFARGGSSTIVSLPTPAMEGHFAKEISEDENLSHSGSTWLIR